MSGLANLIKSPYSKTNFANDKELEDFIKCSDPINGYLYFMNNFFYIQHPTKGSMLYHPWDYQKRLINTYHNYRFSISLMPRQTGKSTSAAGYLLWYAMFVPDSTILIAAHKYAGAQEIMQRVRYAYENCPHYIKAGAVTYNKGSLDFDNGSRIVSAATTENTGRGLSISLLYLDEFAFVRPTIAQEFWTSITPTLSTGGKAIITSTPNSDEDQFALIWKQANKTEDEFGNQTEVGVNGFRAYRAFWTEHPDRDEAWATQMRSQLGTDRFRREMDCIAGDSTLTVKLKDGTVKKMSVDELSHLLKKALCVENLVKNNKDIQVLTDTGWSSFDGVLFKGTLNTVIVKTRNKQIKCTVDHCFFDLNFEKIPAKQLRPGIKIKDTNNFDIVVSVSLNTTCNVYDLLNVNKNHRFYANDLLISNCEFIIADETLIAPSTLFELEGVEPTYKQGQVRWYKKPEKDKIYVVALDPSLGTGGDPSAIQVFEANTTIQIGEWKHNMTTIPEQIRLLKQITDYIADITGDANNIYYSIENNTLGEAALISLQEYGEHNIKGIFLSESGVKKRKGYTTTHKSKLAACAKLKHLIESKKMKINSRSLISELKSFVANSGSYKAKIGETDDLVMSSLLAVRMMQDLGDFHSVLETQIRDYDEFLPPLPFYAVLG
jgi:hypothetical protein